MPTTHTDVVGSLLRPPELLQAQKQLAAGVITASRFKEIEDRAVDDAIALQQEVGLQIVTDGEMRRQSFQGQMTAAVSGFGEHDLDAFLWGEWYDQQGALKKAPTPAAWSGRKTEATPLSLGGRVLLPQKQNQPDSQSDASEPKSVG